MKGAIHTYVSERELEVWRLVALGHPNKTIADVIGISIKTVDKHRSAVFQKLRVHSVADVTRIAVERGVIEVAVRPLTCVTRGQYKRYLL